MYMYIYKHTFKYVCKTYKRQHVVNKLVYCYTCMYILYTCR